MGSVLGSSIGFDSHAADSYVGHQQTIQTAFLNITDIERLAKAGVQVSLVGIVPQPDPFPPTPPYPYNTAPKMEDAIWDRWQRTKQARHTGNGGYGHIDLEGYIRPFQLLATQHGDKVFVSVHPTSLVYEPFMLEDDAVIFPSDALMAKIALWEKDHK
jgi:hypothetical protein